MQSLVFVTRNKDKIDDAIKLLPNHIIEHVDFDIPEIQAFDIREVIAYKITAAYQKVQKPCFVMDTGLYLDCLNGFPGPLIRWFYESVGSDKICQISQLINDTNCHWTTILGFYDGTKVEYIEETVPGDIAPVPRGTGGYAWDNMVIPKGGTKTFSEMTFEEKQSFAVTSRVFNRFQELLGNSHSLKYK